MNQAITAWLMMFASDNWAGACPQVREALAKLGPEVSPAYGADALTLQVNERLSEIFETQVNSLMVATGSAANALALSAFAKPASITLAHKNSHVNVDEYNGPERVNPGLKILGLQGVGSKLSLDELQETLAHFPNGVSRQGRLSSISLTQATELGQIYQIEEIEALSAAVKSYEMGFHMDGARFANALAQLACSPAEITWKAGVDCLSLGFTKNGAWCADLLIFFDERNFIEVDYISKQIGHAFSKPRFIAAQVLAMLENDTWLKNAVNANAQALNLANGLANSNKCHVPTKPQANEVFAYFSALDVTRLQGEGAQFYQWPEEDVPTELRQPGKILMRMVCSFATNSEEVNSFLQKLG